MYEKIAKENGMDDEDSPVPTSVVSVEDWQRSGDKRHFATKTFPSGNTYKGEWLNGKYVKNYKQKAADGHVTNSNALGTMAGVNCGTQMDVGELSSKLACSSALDPMR